MIQNEALIILIVMKKITPVAGYKTIFVSIYFYAVFAPSNFHFHALLSRSMGYEGKQLFHGIEIKVWAIACFVDPREVNDRVLKSFAHQLMKISGETGMPIKSEPCFCKYAKRAEDVSSSTSKFSLTS